MCNIFKITTTYYLFLIYFIYLILLINHFKKNIINYALNQVELR